MTARYYVEIATAGGIRIDLFNDYRELEFTRILNDIGIGKIVVPANHRIINKLELDSVIVIWRWHPDANSGNGERVFGGLFQGIVNKIDSRGNSTAEIIFPDGNILLQRVVNAFKADIVSRTNFNQVANDVILNLLIYNSSTGEPGVRLIDPIGGGGVVRLFVSSIPILPTIQYTGEFKNILTEIQTICESFNLYWTCAIQLDNTFTLTFDFGTYVVDRVLFDMQRANLINSELDLRTKDEVTKVLVLGQGASGNKTTVVRTSSRYSSVNHVEAVVNADEMANTNELNLIGDARIEASKFSPTYVFDTLQVPGCRWCVDYDLGYIVSTKFGTLTLFQRIYQISVSVNDSGETVRLNLRGIRQPEVADQITITESRTVTIV